MTIKCWCGKDIDLLDLCDVPCDDDPALLVARLAGERVESHLSLKEAVDHVLMSNPDLARAYHKFERCGRQATNADKEAEKGLLPLLQKDLCNSRCVSSELHTAAWWEASKHIDNVRKVSAFDVAKIEGVLDILQEILNLIEPKETEKRKPKRIFKMPFDSFIKKNFWRRKT